MISNRDRKIRSIERALLATGLTFLAVFAIARLGSLIASRAAITQFETARHTNAAAERGAWLDPVSNSRIDFRLWSDKRISAYKQSLMKWTGGAPLAILYIPKLNLEVPVFNDTDELTLNRGVGRILGTAQVGQSGNLAIAGHRDGFFRGLRGLTSGDIIQLIYDGSTDTYAVSDIRIVTPEDTTVLRETPVPTLTLVTCFPFYYVGNAPERYIVIAPIAKRISRTALERGRAPFLHNQ